MSDTLSKEAVLTFLKNYEFGGWCKQHLQEAIATGKLDHAPSPEEVDIGPAASTVESSQTMKLTIEISGEGESDLIIPLEIIIKQLGEGYTSGFDENDTGRYNYTIDGELKPKEVEQILIRQLRKEIKELQERILFAESFIEISKEPSLFEIALKTVKRIATENLWVIPQLEWQRLAQSTISEIEQFYVNRFKEGTTMNGEIRIYEP
jgi:hypothetical protein